MPRRLLLPWSRFAAPLAAAGGGALAIGAFLCPPGPGRWAVLAIGLAFALVTSAWMAAQADARARRDAVLECAHDGVLVLATDGTVHIANGAALAMFGRPREDLLRRPLAALVAPESRAALEESLRAGARAASGPRRDELRAVRRDGTTFPLECVLSRITTREGGFCAFLRDLTDARRNELEVRQSQKLEAIGRLVSGVAHEINSPLQFVQNSTEFLADAFAALERLHATCAAELPPELRERLRDVERTQGAEELRADVPQAIQRSLRGLERVTTIVRAMREFAHPGATTMQPTDLNRGIRATLEVARHEFKNVADLDASLAELPPVRCHAGELNQVVLNLVLNAADAVASAARGRGRIRVETRREADEVLVSVSDTGIGMPPEVQRRIFEPFFTTKEVGRGTGQGLAMARSIVQKHGGTLTFTSEPGKGTTFVLRIPLDRQGPAAAAAA